MRAAAVILSLAVSAFAYDVTFPNSEEGWTNQGAQKFTWNRVETDPETFTALLVNEVRPLSTNPDFVF